jgi:hypothetical protein
MKAMCTARVARWWQTIRDPFNTQYCASACHDKSCCMLLSFIATQTLSPSCRWRVITVATYSPRKATTPSLRTRFASSHGVEPHRSLTSLLALPSSTRSFTYKNKATTKFMRWSGYQQYSMYFMRLSGYQQCSM